MKTNTKIAQATALILTLFATLPSYAIAQEKVVPIAIVKIIDIMIPFLA